MSAPTCRRSKDAREECWQVYYGDVQVGRIAIPHRKSGQHVRHRATFDQPRTAFETVWRVFLSKRTEADFQAWRDHQAWTAEKYRRFDRGERMPHDWRASG